MANESFQSGKRPSHWSDMATNWHLNGPPLRPQAQDAKAYWKAAQSWIDQAAQPPRVLLLGVTPELYNLPWPAAKEFLAIERNPAMIEHVWPGPKNAVCVGNWKKLHLPPNSRDLVLCDGGLMMLGAADRDSLITDLYSILSPGGLVIIRSFVLPFESETPAAVIASLLSGGIPNLHVLKLRLSMAIQQSSQQESVALGEVWSCLNLVENDWSRLADRLGWALDQLRYIDSYRDSVVRYHFYHQEKIADQFRHANRFQIKSEIYSDYPLGERCPVATFKKS